jgi:cytochrome c oxidase subunit 4
MTSRDANKKVSAYSLWRRNGLIWIALMLLLTLSLVLAYIPMGAFTTISGILIAFIKAGFVILLFMELADATGLVRLAALAGAVFLSVLFALTLADVLARAWH